MFCGQCGKKSYQEDRFCDSCSAPMITQLPKEDIMSEKKEPTAPVRRTLSKKAIAIIIVALVLAIGCVSFFVLSNRTEFTATMVSAGCVHTVALKDDGTVWAWGDNGAAQLGDGPAIGRHFPAQVQGLTNVTAISAGAVHTIALKSDGSVWALGCNYRGQLGDGTTIDRQTPVQVQFGLCSPADNYIEAPDPELPVPDVSEGEEVEPVPEVDIEPEPVPEVEAEIEQEDLQEEEFAPDFTIPLLAGGGFTLSQHRGTVVVLNFWATWCGPCVAKMPSTQASSEHFGDQVIFLGINLGESPDLVQVFIEEGGYTFPIGLDEEGTIHSNLYPSPGIPFTVVIGRDGVIVGEMVGWNDAMRDELYAMIEEAL